MGLVNGLAQHDGLTGALARTCDGREAADRRRLPFAHEVHVRAESSLLHACRSWRNAAESPVVAGNSIRFASGCSSP